MQQRASSEKNNKKKKFWILANVESREFAVL